MKSFKVLVLFCTCFLLFVLSGCAIDGTNTASVKSAPAATHEAPMPTPAANPLLKTFGQIVTYQDGVSVTVSAPTPYQPSAEAAGGVAGQQDVKVTIGVTNNTKEPISIIGFPNVTSGGKQASEISDVGNNVGNTFDGTLLVGQSISWDDAYSVADPADITFTYEPDYTHKTAIFTSKG